MRNKTRYLTLKEKKAYAEQRKGMPVCVGAASTKNSFIAKLRGTIFDGSLKNKRIVLERS